MSVSGTSRRKISAVLGPTPLKRCSRSLISSRVLAGAHQKSNGAVVIRDEGAHHVRQLFAHDGTQSVIVAFPQLVPELVAVVRDEAGRGVPAVFLEPVECGGGGLLRHGTSEEEAGQQPVE